MQHPMRILTPSFWLQLLTFCGCFGLSTTTWGQVFVRAAATGANDGSSWANAFTDLQLAIDRTANGQIWVAEGIYYPTQCNNCTTHDREQSFQLRDGLSLYGGFRGTESQLSERDVTTYLSRLSGDIGQKGDSTDNSYHVVVAEGSSSLSVLDGFVIEEGNADAAGFNLGGGLYINGSLGNTSSPYIGNCTFRNNYAGGGGAIGMDASAGGTTAPSIDVCTFEGNTASIGLTSFGGAILGVGSQGAQVGPQISNCQFFNNLCGNDGGAIAFSISGDNSQLSAIINQSIFSNNTANDRGGAIWSRLTNRSRSALLIGKCQFVGNRASGEGGAIYNRISFESRGNDQLNNCIFSQNQSGKSAGAIYLRGSQQGNSTFRIVNSQLDRNRASTSGGAMYLDADEFAPGTIDAEIINCSFANNRAGGTAGSLFLEQGGGQLTIDLYNSILWGGSIPSIRNQGASGNVAHCILQEDLPSGLANEGNNLQEDPDYADADNGDLHLLRCSPAIDAGNNSLLSNLYRLDLGENDRIYDNRIDMGAYENGQILYVHFLASGGNTGENWDNAFTRLEYALEQAEASNQIWIDCGRFRRWDGRRHVQSIF
ncbi:MAG: choice-of-anchor Q domain-containing protein, partial [Bacteroidota bacterium]